MIKVYRETPKGHEPKGLRHVLKILEYKRESCNTYQEKIDK